MFFSPPASCVLTVRQAAIHGVRLNNQILRLAWHKAVMNLSATEADEAEPEDDEVCRQFSLCIHEMMRLKKKRTSGDIWMIFVQISSQISLL